MSYDEKRFSDLIYDILHHSDLETVSAKKIRTALSEKLGYDVGEYKKAINDLIASCFDRVNAENANGTKAASSSPAPPPPPRPSSTNKRKEPSDDSDLSDVADERRKKKVRKQDAQEDDAAYAARLQREENTRARPTRAGATRKAAPAKRKKKSAVKVKDGSDVESSGEPKVRKGGFHKPMNLSEPLAILLGETQLSRPQTVKKIWEYVKSKDLQDPADKRQIVCDDLMRAVFKQDRVHMFTMNKILNQNLYPAEEVVQGEAVVAASEPCLPAPSSAPSSPPQKMEESSWQ